MAAHYIQPGGGCMANDPGYWRAFAEDIEGKPHAGTGETAQAAEWAAEDNAKIANKFLAKSPREQLDIICQKEQMLDSDQVRAIRLINEILKGGS